MNTDIGTQYKYQSVLRGIAHISASKALIFATLIFAALTFATLIFAAQDCEHRHWHPVQERGNPMLTPIATSRTQVQTRIEHLSHLSLFDWAA